jgi:HD superfamily phosphohydrolase
MKYPYPNEVKNGSDLIKYFAWYFNEKFGYYMSSQQWRISSRFIKDSKEKDKTMEDMKILVWGMINTNNKVKSINYCSYFWDKLKEFKKLKEKYDKNKEKEKNEEIEYISIEDEEGEDIDEL